MKPTTENKKQHSQRNQRFNFPTAPNRVPVEFLPSVGWQVEIGRTPVKTFAVAQTLRDNAAPAGYKRARGSSRPAHVFVPAGLVIDAAEQRATARRMECRAAPKLSVNL